ncbi:MAG: hypothetical protein IT163_15340 [Bryobacterales bacterium]|nr:hypothetical protein [Bryobacterales bacterium]
MPSYRVFRMKDHVRQSFRWAAHTLGQANVKPRDYMEQEQTVEASSPYAAWMQCKDTDAPLDVGDLLQSEAGGLYIYKYVGFEDARWVLPEAKAESRPGDKANDKSGPAHAEQEHAAAATN